MRKFWADRCNQNVIVLFGVVVLLSSCTAIRHNSCIPSKTLCVGNPEKSYLDWPTAQERYSAMKKYRAAVEQSMFCGNRGIYIDGKLCVIASVDQVIPVTAIYSLESLELACGEKTAEKNGKSLISHPILPSEQDLLEIKNATEKSGMILYYHSGQGAGWAIFQNGAVTHVWEMFVGSY